MDFGAHIGLEELGINLTVQIASNINAQIDLQQAHWDAKDQSLSLALSRVNTPIYLEHVEPENIYKGHIPSIIEAAVDKFPNIAVFAYSATSQPGGDQFDEYNCLAYVNTVVRSFVSEEEVNARVQRMVEALHASVMVDPTIGGIASDVYMRSTAIGDVFDRPEQTRLGDTLYWQQGRLEYQIRKIATY